MGKLILEFLEARITEDEQRARDFDHALALAINGDYGNYDACYGAPASWATLERIGFTPARVLAECASKRAILAEHHPEVETVEWFDDATGTGMAPVCPSCRPKDPTDWNPPMGMAGVRPEGFVPSYVLAPCPTLQALTVVYKDHPDYIKVFPDRPQTAPAP